MPKRFGLVKEARSNFPERLSGRSVLVLRAKAFEDIGSIGSVFVTATTATQIDTLSWKARRGESRVPDENLAVRILKSRRRAGRRHLHSDPAHAQIALPLLL